MQGGSVGPGGLAQVDFKEREGEREREEENGREIGRERERGCE